MNGERLDLETIVQVVPPQARVLDLGCGDGILLSRLAQEKQVEARGVEISEEKVRSSISKGVSVRHGNIEDGLADYRDGAFDYVILSLTIAYLNQPLPVVREMLRVGKHAIISFENAGHWSARWRAISGCGMGNTLASGEPRTRAITLDQFREFCGKLGAKIEQSFYLSGRHRIAFCPCCRAAVAVFVVSKA